MMGEYTGVERRERPCGDSCSTHTLKAMETDAGWKTWAVRLIIVFLIGGNVMGAYVVTNASAKDNTQDTRITSVEIKQENIGNKLDKVDEKLDKLIELATQTNLTVQTHIASSD